VTTLLIILYVIIAILLTVIILLQSSKATNMGLFGSSDTVLGSAGADTLTKITGWFAVAFVVIAFSISYIMSRAPTGLDKELEKVKKAQQQEQQQQPQQAQPQQPNMIPSAGSNK
jgi:protein translocase SecG subunit